MQQQKWPREEPCGEEPLQRMSGPKTQTCRSSGAVKSCLGSTVKSPQDSNLLLPSGKCKALAWEAGPLIPGCPTIFWDLSLLCKGGSRARSLSS